MILRRLMAHVRDQNWFAVALDFVIVVSGIFVGLQVDRWNEARKVDADEREFLARVRVDIAQDAVDMKSRGAYLEAVMQSGERVLAFLDEERPCEGDCWEILTDYFQASQWQDLTPNRVTFVDNRRVGFPRSAELERTLVGYYALFDSLVVVAAPPRYRELVRSHIPSAAQDRFWRDCHVIRPRDQRILEACPPALTDAEAGAVVEALRAHPEMRPALQFWSSTLVGVVETVRVQIAEADAIVAAISAELGEAS